MCWDQGFDEVVGLRCGLMPFLIILTILTIITVKTPHRTFFLMKRCVMQVSGHLPLGLPIDTRSTSIDE